MAVRLLSIRNTYHASQVKSDNIRADYRVTIKKTTHGTKTSKITSLKEIVKIIIKNAVHDNNPSRRNLSKTLSWPSTLSTYPGIDGYSETLPNTVLRTSMEAGPPKVRRRFTAAQRPFKMTMVLTTAEVAYFDTFFVTTTEGGALQFSWTHPRTTVAGSFRFVGQPVYTTYGNGLYRVEFQVELLP